MRQSAYQVIVASTPELLAKEKADLWDTGKVTSDAMQHIVYAGRPLAARQQCWWKVRVWDEAGQAGPWSEAGYWSTGLQAESNWSAAWIGLDPTVPTDGTQLNTHTRKRIAALPWVYADMEVSKTLPLTAQIRGTVTIPAERKLVRGALAITVDQAGAITVNGKAAGTVTRWEQIAPIDITALLTTGENIVNLEITQRDGYPPAATAKGVTFVRFAHGVAVYRVGSGKYEFTSRPAP